MALSPYTPYSIYLELDFDLDFAIGVILGLYGDNEKENGNYYIILGLYWGYRG